MNKSGKISLAIGILAATVGVVTPASIILVNKTNSESQGIDPHIKCGDHVWNVAHTKITLGNSFKVKIDNIQKGFAKIDLDKTKVLIGNKEVTNKQYISDTVFEIDGKDVDSSDISIYVEAEPTVLKAEAVWTKKPAEWFDYCPNYLVDQETVIPEHIKVTLTYGDGTTKIAQPGSGDECYSILKFNEHTGAYLDITESFKQNGYPVTIQDITRSTGDIKATSRIFQIAYYSSAYKYTEHLEFLCHKKIEYIKLDEDSLKEGMEVPLNDNYMYGAEVSEGAVYLADYNEVRRTGASDAVLSKGWLFTGGEKGTITIQLVSKVDPTVKSPEYTITIG